MRPDIQFPPLCALCRPYYAPQDCPAGVYHSPGIGEVCSPCRRLVGRVSIVLRRTKGITPHMIPDGDRNDTHPTGGTSSGMSQP